MWGYRLKEARKKAGLTQEKASEKINTARSNISKYESEKANPDMDILRNMCIVYNVSADYILGIEINASVENKNITYSGNIGNVNM